jgi:hypothetical protein
MHRLAALNARRGEKRLGVMAALFTLGEIVITPEAERLMTMLSINPASLLLRHVTGDWGDASDDQKRTNEEAVREGGRVLSVYGSGRRRLYVMTNAERSTTTILPRQENV